MLSLVSAASFLMLPTIISAIHCSGSGHQWVQKKGGTEYTFCPSLDGTQQLCVEAKFHSVNNDQYQWNAWFGNSAADECVQTSGIYTWPDQDHTYGTNFEHNFGSTSLTGSDKSPYKQTCLGWELVCVTPGSGDTCQVLEESWNGGNCDFLHSNSSMSRRSVMHFVPKKGTVLVKSNATAVERSTQPVAVRGKGFIPPTSPVPMLNSSLLRFSNVPDAIDWTTKGATTEIRDQGTCGCCWAFATAEAVESAAFMAGGTLEKLSAGQICRCDTSDGGCKGGNPSSAFDYVRSKGLDSYAHDPYGDQVNDKSTDTCEWDGSVAATITGYKQVAQDEESLAAALATYGPLAICINAEVWPNDEGGSDWSWTGIAPWADKCTNKQADHCVQLVGYDKTASTPYWKLRNQWGNTWGESGYVRLPFGSDSCGITQAAYIVEGAKLSGAQILV